MKKVILMLIILAMIWTTVSCNSNKSLVDSDNSIDETTLSEETTAEIPSNAPNFPERDYEGYEFNVLAENEYNAKYLIDVEEDGDKLNDAAYTRNLKVAERFNINFSCTETPESQIYNDLKKTVLSGDSTYSLVIPNPLWITASMMADHLLYNINDLTYVDLSKPWWNSSIVENFKIGDKLFFATGDYSITYQGFVVLLYNKLYIENYNLENPYETVFNDKWTVDKFTEMLKLVSADIDGDGKFTKEDQYGYTAIAGCGYIFMFACDQNITEPDADGIPRLALNTERMVTIVEKYYDIMRNGNYTYVGGEREILDIFKANRAMFTAIDIGCYYGRTRDIELDFGLLPYPKLDEAQEKYLVGFGGGVFAVPRLCDAPERTGIILEALNYESYVHLRPEFFDTVLHNKCLRDEESVKILTLLHENKKCDFGFNFDTTGLGFQVLSTLVEGKKSYDFASYYQTIESKLNNGFEKLISKIME